jgi:hypothetical protein
MACGVLGSSLSPNDIVSFSCHAGSMKEGGQDPESFTAAKRTLEEYLRRASPEIWRVLEDPGVEVSHLPEALVFAFGSDDEDVFDRITMAPSLEILKGATRATGYKIKLKCGSKEVLVDAR